MRLFTPKLPPSKSFHSSFRFNLETKCIKYIWISHDLSHLQIHTQNEIKNKRKRKMLSTLNESTHDLPLFLPVWETQSSFHIFGLPDINLKLKEIARELNETDPFFFTELQESENLDDGTIQSVLSLTPLRCQFFGLESKRGEKIHHTIELPLKSLQNEKFLKQEDINKMMIDIWKRINLIRAQKNDTTKLPEYTDLPYVFR